MAVLPLSGGAADGRRRGPALRARRASDGVQLRSRTGRTCRSTPRSGSPAPAAPRWRCRRPGRLAGSTPAHVAADDVAVEVRGAGPATRQVTNFMSPEAFDGADKLMCVELLTPDGNWSSYPPHRHDDSPECPVNNEEIYYFRIGTRRHDRLRPGRFRPAPHLHARGRRRRHCDGRRRGHVPRPARLPRPVRRRTRISAVLPQRARRTRRRAIDGVLRRPGAPLGPRLVGATWPTDPARADDAELVEPMTSTPSG